MAENVVDEKRRHRTFVCMIVMLISLFGMAMGADDVIGIKGIHYLFSGAGAGMWFVLIFYRFIAKYGS